MLIFGLMIFRRVVSLIMAFSLNLAEAQRQTHDNSPSQTGSALSSTAAVFAATASNPSSPSASSSNFDFLSTEWVMPSGVFELNQTSLVQFVLKSGPRVNGQPLPQNDPFNAALFLCQTSLIAPSSTSGVFDLNITNTWSISQLTEGRRKYYSRPTPDTADMPSNLRKQCGLYARGYSDSKTGRNPARRIQYFGYVAQLLLLYRRRAHLYKPASMRCLQSPFHHSEPTCRDCHESEYWRLQYATRWEWKTGTAGRYSNTVAS